MIEPVLHLFKVHRKMILGNPPVVVQDVLGERPEAFDTVDVIFGAFVDHTFVVRNGVVLAKPLQGIVASEGVRVVDRALPRFLPNDCHEFLFGHMLHHSRIHLAITLQKPKNNVFAHCSASALPLASAAKVALVHLHFAVQSAALKLGHMVDRFSEFLIDARNRLVVEAEVMRETVGRLLLIEPLHYSNFRSDAFQGFLSSTAFIPTADIPSTRLRNLERAAENTLLSPQKVGCAPENVLLPLCHMDILVPYGYETP
jgi:hypothetical protein